MTSGELSELAATRWESPRVPELEKAPFLTCRVTLGKDRVEGCSENLKPLHHFLQMQLEESHPRLQHCARCFACVEIGSEISVWDCLGFPVFPPSLPCAHCPRDDLGSRKPPACLEWGEGARHGQSSLRTRTGREAPALTREVGPGLGQVERG